MVRQTQFVAGRGANLHFWAALFGIAITSQSIAAQTSVEIAEGDKPFLPSISSLGTRTNFEQPRIILVPKKSRIHWASRDIQTSKFEVGPRVGG